MQEHEQKDKEFSIKKFFVPLTTIKAIHWIIFIGLIIFCNGLFNDFVADDISQVSQNPYIESLYNIPSFFSGSTFYSGNGENLNGIYFRPLMPVYYTVIYSIFGQSAFFFHLFQIILIITNACLLFILFKHFFKIRIAFLLSLLFLVHPVNSEVAFYIADVPEGLYFLFGVIALLLLIKNQKTKNLIIASIMLFFSILSKEAGILFFCICPVYLFFFHRKYFFKMFIVEIIFFGIYMIMRTHAIGFFPHTVPNAPIKTLSLTTRLLNIPAIVLFYITTFIYPVNLSFSYQWIYSNISFNGFLGPFIIDVITIAILCTPAFFIHKHKDRKSLLIYLFFAIWLFIGMLLILQIYPLDATVADGWFYFPMAGLSGILGIFLTRYDITKSKAFLIFLFVLFMLFSYRVILRSFDFRDNLILSSHDLSVSNDSFSVESLLSYAYLQEGDYKDALIHAQNSVKLFPYVINYTNLGSAYAHLGMYPQAKIAYLKALNYYSFYLTYENLGILDLFYGNKKQNITYIKTEALNRYPDDPILWDCLATLNYETGNKENAREEIERAYEYGQTQQIDDTYNIIMNNEPLHPGVQ